MIPRNIIGVRCVLGAAALIFCLNVGNARAQQSPVAVAPSIPTGGQEMLPADALANPDIANTSDLKLETVAVAGQTFASALSLQTLKQPANAWDLQLSLAITAPIHKGDVLLASLWMRALQTDSGYVRTNLILENATTYNKSVYFEASAGRAWKHIFVPFVAAEDEPAGRAFVRLHLGFLPQTVALAQVSLLNYGQNADIKSLPVTAFTYEGRELSAPWRRAAQARIEKLRKGNLQVRVFDASGHAVRHARVNVAMTRHAFDWGASLDNRFYYDQSPEGQKYRDTFFQNFNVAVLGRALKYGEWNGDSYDAQGHRYTREEALAFVKFLRDRNIRVRGHNLVWPSWMYLPSLKPLASDPAKLQQTLIDHITDEVSALKGQCYEWDVVNEPFSNHDIIDIVGEKNMAEWLKAAHRADPNARLFVNDNGILEGGGDDLNHINAYYNTIATLQKNGAPLGGIGMEGHFSQLVTPPTRVLELLDKFAKLGVPIKVTEFDVSTPDETLMADYMRDYMTLMFSHPAVNGFVQWGFWEGDHWIPQAAPWKHDFSLRPNGQVFRDLVFKQWWTNASGQTNAKGNYQTRGFLGAYTITATANGKTATQRATLVKAGTTLVLQLK